MYIHIEHLPSGKIFISDKIEHLPSGKIFISDKIEHLTKEEVQNLLASTARGVNSYIRLKINNSKVFFNERILKDSVLYMEVIE